ncbi:MAG TPA: hypothetical protein VJ508_02830 [Saprospiraceae bacterium]|nr:hypothetical protein [Saprospiraceae bacterium]
MKLNVAITTFLIISAFTLMKAQPGMLSPEGRQRIEAQRIAFITQRLRLTPDEATKFWPLYNEYRDALKDMRDEFERPDLETMSDDDASALIEKHLQMEQKRLDLKRNLFTRLRTVITPRKIILLRIAENEFNRELLRKAQEFRKP